MQKITPFLWFDNNLEDAMKFYISVFKNSSVVSLRRYTKAGPGPEGSVMTATFILDGQEFSGLNGGPYFKFNEAVSFYVKCDTQEEIDYYWEKLSEGGSKIQCGWLKDKFGISWQIVPPLLGELLGDKDTAKAQRVMQSMMKMTKIVIQELQDAYDQQ